jgi:hypothetical protein
MEAEGGVAEGGAEGDVCATEAGGGAARLVGAGTGAGASTTCDATMVRWRVGQKNAPTATTTTTAISAHSQRITATLIVPNFS